MRSWPSLLEYSHIPFYHCILCHRCRTRVASVEDYILTGPYFLPGGIFSRVFNVEIPDETRHRQLFGNTVANILCVQCDMVLGWEFIAVPRPSRYIREGRFYMSLHNLSFWDGVPLFHLNTEQDLGANEENADQDGDANEQVPNEQDTGANEQNADEDGDANEQVPNEQDLGANVQVLNEQVANQDVDQLSEGMDNIDLNPDI